MRECGKTNETLVDISVLGTGAFAHHLSERSARIPLAAGVSRLLVSSTEQQTLFQPIFERLAEPITKGFGSIQSARDQISAVWKHRWGNDKLTIDVFRNCRSCRVPNNEFCR
jgi:hypothetical protein